MLFYFSRHDLGEKNILNISQTQNHKTRIVTNLGRNVTRIFIPHRNRTQFPNGNEIFVYGRKFKS